jgi:hypothetical protein
MPLERKASRAQKQPIRRGSSARKNVTLRAESACRSRRNIRATSRRDCTPPTIWRSQKPSGKSSSLNDQFAKKINAKLGGRDWRIVLQQIYVEMRASRPTWRNFPSRLRPKSPELRRLRGLRLRIEQKEKRSHRPNRSGHFLVLMTACAYLVAAAIGITLSIPRPSM